MSDEALWNELARVAEEHLKARTPPAFAESFRRVARCLALCRRIGLDAPDVHLLERASYDDAELDAFFQKIWRLTALHAEQSGVDLIEARGGVDNDAADFARLRALLAEARGMILDFGWLPEKAKRRHLDQLEALQTQLQRARDDFDVAFAGVRDAKAAAAVEIGRPNALRGAWRWTVRLLGPNQVEPEPGRTPPRALPKLGPSDDV